MLFLEIEREPNKRCANSNNWRSDNTLVQRHSRRYILDLAKKKNVWIGWKKLTSSRTALVGILRLTRSTTAFATSRVFRRWWRRFFTKHREHARAGAARVGGNAARVAGMSAGERMTKS